jgi:hypothetical protein
MVKFQSGTEARISDMAIINMVERSLGLVETPGIPDAGSSSAKEVLKVELSQQEKGQDVDAGFGLLSRFDTIFVIDDTGSMQLSAKSSDSSSAKPVSRWDTLVRCLQYIADIAAKYDDDGIEMRFLIHKELNTEGIKNGQEVLNLLAKVDLSKGSGGTFFEPVLAAILGPYVGRYKDYFEAAKKKESALEPKPINIIILTDGLDDEAEETEDLLKRIAQKLDNMYASASQVGIQFLQVGDDEGAAKFLDHLDNDLKKQHDIRDVS